MKMLIYLLLASFLLSCSDNKSKQPKAEEKPIDNVIRLADAIDRMRKVNLSELTDSITYLPLETRKECLLRNTSWFKYCPPYIISNRLVFDMNNGKFVRQIGRSDKGREKILPYIRK